jgi:thioredoxin 2
MSQTARQIVCPHCDSINRVPTDRDARKGKCGRCHQPLFAGGPMAASSKSFDAQIKHSDSPVVVDFWAEWCGPCKAMAPGYERVAAALEPQMRFLKVDTEAAPDLAERYSIRSIPTLMVFRNGQIAAQRAGALDERTLRAWLQPFAAAASPQPAH